MRHCDCWRFAFRFILENHASATTHGDGARWRAGGVMPTAAMAATLARLLRPRPDRGRRRRCKISPAGRARWWRARAGQAERSIFSTQPSQEARVDGAFHYISSAPPRTLFEKMKVCARRRLIASRCRMAISFNFDTMTPSAFRRHFGRQPSAYFKREQPRA